MDWSWDDLARSGGVLHARVEVASEIPDQRADGQVVEKRLLSFARIALDGTRSAGAVEIRSLTPRGRLVVYGVAVVDRAGNPQQLFGRHKSKYREIVRNQDVVVLENTAAYPRAFLVRQARIAPPGRSLDLMDSQPFVPREEVILAAETPPIGLTPTPARTVAGAAPAPPGQVWIQRYTPLEVTIYVDSPAPAFLILTDTFYPGWQAYLDGQPRSILRGDLIFRVVEVPAGTHRVVFRFEPASVWLGLATSLGVLALCFGVLFARIRLPRPG